MSRRDRGAVGKKRYSCNRLPVSNKDLAQRSAGRRQRGKSRTQPRLGENFLHSRHQSHDCWTIGSAQPPDQLTGQLRAIADKRRDRQPESLLNESEIGVLRYQIVIGKDGVNVRGAQLCGQPLVVAEQYLQLVEPIRGGQVL
jgi:hypothetical protein